MAWTGEGLGEQRRGQQSEGAAGRARTQAHAAFHHVQHAHHELDLDCEQFRAHDNAMKEN
jgi:hypothetical protein